jgi:hypothetical protein
VPPPKLINSFESMIIINGPAVPQPGGSGTIIASNGTTWVASTPTFPNASATVRKIIVSDGTNWVASTETWALPGSTAGKVLVSDGTNWVTSTPTFPNASATSGKIIQSDGTNWIASTPTFPTGSQTSGKILKSDGTNWTASTETYAAPGSSGNVLTSDGTNWTSAAPAGASVTIKAGTTTKDTADASTAQTIAHGLGSTPHYVRITAMKISSVNTHTHAWALAVYDGTTQSNIKMGYNAGFIQAAAFVLNADEASGSNAGQTGVITFDSTNITITWTKAGVPTGIFVILWEAFK